MKKAKKTKPVLTSTIKTTTTTTTNNNNNNKRNQKAVLTLEDVFGQIALTSTNTRSGGIHDDIPLTPLSSEACLRHGINPDHLRERKFETFQEKDGNADDLEIQRLKYETYERRRHDLMKVVSDERAKLKKDHTNHHPSNVNNGGAGGGGMDNKSCCSVTPSLTPSAILAKEELANSTLLELEEKRLRKAKEKQKKELLQMLQFEQKREKMQEDMRLKAEREIMAEEKKKAKKIKQERRAAEETRLRELRRKAQEDAQEEMLRISARERYEKERQIEKEKERQALENKRRLREMEEERTKKREMQKKQTEEQQARKRMEAERKLKEREVKERERQIRIEKKRAMDQYEFDKKRADSARRIEMNKEAARKREEVRKQNLIDKMIKSELKEQKKQMAREQERELSKKEREALSRKREFQAKLSRDREEEVKAMLLKKFEDDEKNVNQLKAEKDKELALIKEERELHTQLKRDNVDRIKRMQEYRRIETMKKVSEDDKRTTDMLKKREELAKTRRNNAVEAKIRRDALIETIEKSKSKGGKALKKILDQLSSDDGDIGNPTSSPKTKKKKAKKKKKSSAPKVEISPRRTKSKFDSSPVKSIPPSVIEMKIGPRPNAPSLLARIEEKQTHCKPFISPYASVR